MKLRIPRQLPSSRSIAILGSGAIELQEKDDQLLSSARFFVAATVAWRRHPFWDTRSELVPIWEIVRRHPLTGALRAAHLFGTREDGSVWIQQKLVGSGRYR